MVTQEELELVLFYAFRGLQDANASEKDSEVYKRVRDAVRNGEIGFVDSDPSDAKNPYAMPYDQALEMNLRNNGKIH